jgi:hypothetical protein
MPQEKIKHMTALVCWIGVDSRGPSSVYIATESAISWTTKVNANSPDAVWSSGQKVFACKTQPDLFGFFGHVGFPTMVISQLVDLIDRGVLFEKDAPSELRTQRVISVLKWSQLKHPEWCGPFRLLSDFWIIHVMREGEGMKCRFRIWEHAWKVGQGWSSVEKSVPTVSGVIISGGSGAAPFSVRDKTWKDSDIGRTSRGVFSAFADSLKAGDDPFCGGAPQLGGLYRIGTSHQFGIIYDGKRYFSGIEVSADWATGAVDWFNERFERCDPETLQIKTGAQPQPRPKGI